jgi:hypothetical protein
MDVFMLLRIKISRSGIPRCMVLLLLCVTMQSTAAPGEIDDRFRAMSKAGMPVRSTETRDIRKLSDHFEPGKPRRYTFQASDDAYISTEEHPGLLTIYHSGRDEEIRGILDQPIKLADYPPPWECEMDIMHSFWTKTSYKIQINMAIGMNVELTFSDPSTWPEDRTQRPPDTHSFRVYFVHIGSAWPDGLEEDFLVWGDCDDPDAYPHFQGDWDADVRITYYEGKGVGPSKTHYYPTVMIDSPTHLAFTLRYNQQNSPYISRGLDVSRYGKITGVWNIGPIIASQSWIKERWPEGQPVPRDAEAYFGFVDFRHKPPFPTIEHFTNDFEHPGFIGRYSTEYHGHIAETWSHPGYLAITLAGGNNLPGGNFAPGDRISLKHYKPPWELEMSFVPPSSDYPWSIVHGFGPREKDGGSRAWHPGVANFPGKGHEVGNVQIGHSSGRNNWDTYIDQSFGPHFTEALPEETFKQGEIYLLTRILSTRHLQMGVKGRPDDPWQLTPVWECPYEIDTMWDHSLSYQTGKGAPANQQYLIDYLHYRQGIEEVIPATLSFGQVSPAIGFCELESVWSVNYFDFDGVPPKRTWVYIDGLMHEMQLVSGTPELGTYQFGPRPVQTGEHNYHFQFVDHEDNIIRYPTEGPIRGPVFQKHDRVVYEQHFDVAGIDVYPEWVVGAPDGIQPTQVVGEKIGDIVDAGGGDYALLTGCQSDFDKVGDQVRVQCTTPFSRGDNLRVTFKTWGGKAFPSGSGIMGPWHRENNPVRKVNDDVEAGLNWWGGMGMRWEENSLLDDNIEGDLGPGGGTLSGPLLDSAFVKAFSNAKDKSRALIARVWVGDQRGGKMEWFDPGTSEWKTLRSRSGKSKADPKIGDGVLIDSRHADYVPPPNDHDGNGDGEGYRQAASTADPLYLAFGAGCNVAGGLFIDDIVVERDR